ncbi:hypothetical protein [Nocardioides stalactiti]|uniref:hypothetical protein n=1 Tax=Nocardioides stalactiti TaxID=2755356 RepID=UPI0015FF4D54|nr:hypothetical protein [Nocardioides stalactiti]
MIIFKAISAGSTWNLTNAALAVVASLIGVIVFVASTGPGSRFLVSRVLAGARRRTVVKVLVTHGVSTRRAALSAARKMTTDLLDGQPHDANAELEWLADLRGDGLPMAFVAAGDPSRRVLLNFLADSYEVMAGTWRSRLIFGTRASDLVASMAAVAERTSSILREHASNASLEHARKDAVEIDLRARGHFARVMYTTRNIELSVSPHSLCLKPIDGRLRKGGAQPQFEGILPLLLDEQLELDEKSGRHRLHLAIAKMPYSQLLNRNTKWDPTQIPASSRDHAISLALLPVSADGCILFVRRSEQAGSYPGMIGPLVTGNAELRDRRGLRADRDPEGIPDLLSAICREAREEVGLQLDPGDLRVLGLARIWSPEDTAIWCLITTAALRISAAEVASRARYADHVEGAWEVGSELFAVDPWRTQNADVDVLKWAASADLVPQAVASLAALMRKSGTDIAIDWATATQSATNLTAPVLQTIPLRHPFR